MSQQKKNIRNKFRTQVFERDGYKCRVCGWNKDITKLDAHHVCDRNLLPNGGYVKENGITLCPTCHMLAETFHCTGLAENKYSPEDLYELIGSSREEAYEKSRLG